jgi:hypothetical protein
MDVPSVSRIVHYVAPTTQGGAVMPHRAAIITDASANGGVEGLLSVVSLCVFHPTGNEYIGTVPYSSGHEPGTWHWPERVPAATATAKATEDAMVRTQEWIDARFAEAEGRISSALKAAEDRRHIYSYNIRTLRQECACGAHLDLMGQPLNRLAERACERLEI